MKVLDLFSGIGGFSLGLERAGFETVAFCEVDKKARLVLNKHWPDVPIYEDVKELTYEQLHESGINVDVICGGFPCQDISLAGGGAGLAGSRSGLWFEYCRLIEEIKPKYAIIENVSALRSRGLDAVLGSLAAIGYDAQWHCIPASAIGAPHRRDRIWIVAYPTGGRFESMHYGYTETKNVITPSSDVSNAVCQGLERQRSIASRIGEELQNIGYSRWWEVEPDVGRVANGVPNRVDRLKQLGNAVIPQIPELIGRAIMAHESMIKNNG